MRHQEVQQQQSSLQANSQGDSALGSVQFSAGTPSFSVQRGFSNTVVDNGTGDTTLTLTNPQVLSTSAVLGLAFNIATGAIGSAIAGSTSSDVRVRTWSLTIASPAVSAAADIDFWVRVTPISPS